MFQGTNEFQNLSGFFKVSSQKQNLKSKNVIISVWPIKSCTVQNCNRIPKIEIARLRMSCHARSSNLMSFRAVSIGIVLIQVQEVFAYAHQRQDRGRLNQHCSPFCCHSFNLLANIFGRRSEWSRCLYANAFRRQCRRGRGKEKRGRDENIL